jgi:small GTP-binding protein
MSDEPAHNQIPAGFKLRYEFRASGLIYRIAWSPDGRTLASVGYNGVIRLWDAEVWGLCHTLEGHNFFVTSVAWSPDGEALASGDYYGNVRLWNVEAGRLRATLGRHAGQVNSVAWSPGGETLASGDADGTVKLWDVKAGKLRLDFEGHRGKVNGVAWSPDGRTVASAGEDGTIRLWDVRAKKSGGKFDLHAGEINCVAWLPDGETLASGGADGTIRLCNAKTVQLALTLEGHTDAVHSISFSFDVFLLASKSLDKTLRLWRCDTWESVAVFDAWTSTYLRANLAFHPKAPVLATLGHEDKAILVWDLDFDALLGAAPKREDVLYTTAKITLVGDSGAGKTGLGWRLAHDEFKEHPSTHGQQFWVVDELGATRNDGTQCEAVLWDLAGQPDYRLVHALFLDDVDLALVLFDPTNWTEPLKGVEYWLKQLLREREDGLKRRVILVGARADRGTPTLTEQELEEFCKQQGVEGGYVGTSALTGEGLPELLTRVKASIVWNEIPATVTTKTFKRIKEYVLALKADGEREGVLVSPDELRTRLEATDAGWRFTGAEMMTAVRHLSNHGYVSVLRGSKGEKTVLLVPDLLANLASSFVLEARRNPRGLGALEEARVLKGGYEFPELNGLDAGERDVLLDAAVVLFIEHNLCFRETLGAQTLLIFPALINQKRPPLGKIETADDFSYRVTGAVENVYAALVVQLGYTNTFTRTNQWQNQAEYETARGDVCGFRQVNEGEGETELVLYYAREKPGARLLFQGLFEEFLRGRDVTATKFPPVTCPACGYRQQRAEVVKRVGEGKGFLFCGECSERIALPKEGERVTLSRAERKQLDREQERTRRRTEFESALVRVKAVVRDEKKRSPSCFISYAWGDEGHERWVRGLSRDLENAGIEVILDRKDNPQVGANVARFISRIDQSDFVVVVGTPLYRRKYENKVSETGSIVAAEVDLINLRLTGTEEEKATVLPLLLEGGDRDSFPPLVRGKGYSGFVKEESYFPVLFDLILMLYYIHFENPAVSDLREKLRGGGEVELPRRR